VFINEVMTGASTYSYSCEFVMVMKDGQQANDCT